MKQRLLDQAARWKRVPAKILARDIVDDYSAGFLRYRPAIFFEARINGEVVRSNRFSLDSEDFEGERTSVEAQLKPYAPGAEIEVFVDPRRLQHPVACIEVPAARRKHYRNCIIAGCALVGVALVAGGYIAP